MLNAWRTAAADALAVQHLARADARVLTLIGAGHQALHDVLAIAEVRALERIHVCSRSTASAEALAATLRERGFPAEASDLEAAVRAADIVATVTPARAPLFPADWLRPGAHVSAMGADARGKQELDPTLLSCARLFADLPVQSRRIGEFQNLPPPPASSPNTTPTITALGAVIAGAAEGRRNADEITVFDSSGVAVQDLAIADAVASR